jgi:hypothetical protein
LNYHLYYFDKEKENETSRSINLENEKGAYGYLVLDNRSNGILYEKLTLYEFEKINFIYFTKSLTKKKNKINNMNREINEDLIEDKNTREIVVNLLGRKYMSTFEETKINILNIPEKNNPFELMIKVASNTIFILIFEKCDEFATINMKSQIIFKYPLYMIISENKNNSTIDFLGLIFALSCWLKIS